MQACRLAGLKLKFGEALSANLPLELAPEKTGSGSQITLRADFKKCSGMCRLARARGFSGSGLLVSIIR